MSRELELARELVRKLEEAEKDSKVQLSELQPGETFKIGEHDFIVLEQKNGCSGTTNVISKGFMSEDIVFDDDTKDYNNSNLKKIIEENIQPAIEAGVGVGNIIEQVVSLTSVDMQGEFKPCYCKVRPITFDEARKYNNLLVNKDLDDWWWTCTPWSTADRGWKRTITVVSPSGDVGDGDCGGRNGVRPFCILKSNIFVSKGE
jgi:hypothetical protein